MTLVVDHDFYFVLVHMGKFLGSPNGRLCPRLRSELSCRIKACVIVAILHQNADLRLTSARRDECTVVVFPKSTKLFRQCCKQMIEDSLSVVVGGEKDQFESRDRHQ